MAAASGVKGFMFAATCRDRGPIRGSLSNPRPFSKPRRNLETGLLKSIVRFTADERSSRLFGVCGESNRRRAPSEGGERGGVVGLLTSLFTGDSSDIESLKGLEKPRSQPSSVNSGDIGSTSLDKLSFPLLTFSSVEDLSVPWSFSSKTNGSFPMRLLMKAIEPSSCRMIFVRFENYFGCKSAIKLEQNATKIQGQTRERRSVDEMCKNLQRCGETNTKCLSQPMRTFQLTWPTNLAGNCQ